MFTTDIAELADLRRAVLNGEELPPEKYAIVLASIRKKRTEGATRKTAAAPVDTEKLLTGLMNIPD